MIRAVLLITCAMGLAAPIAAETRLSPEQFESDSVGKTIYFRDSNLQFSAEQYFPNRRVLLLHFGSTCTYGHWRPEGDLMCFYYENDPEQPHCWRYIKTHDNKRLHRFVDETGPTNYELTILKEDNAPLDCPAPPLGVSYTPAIQP